MRARGLSGDGTPLVWTKRPTCGATTRNGGKCKLHVLPGKFRCRMHGGLSTGPRTPEGKARISEANRIRWTAWRAKRA
ncbi:MAG: hypothetical protein B7Y61_02830 [Rhizobiales bacterium 35-66-30]|nr:MAG: hypothetical protein B7Y61_02830 [Rhizobiales bacterium 35-66-30]